MNLKLPKKPLFFLLLSVGIVHLADFVLIPILPILLGIHKGLRPAQIGLIIGVGALNFQIGSIGGGILSDKIGRKITLLIGTLITIIALIGYGLSNSYFLFILFEALSGIGTGCYPPTLKAAIAKCSDNSNEDKTNAFSLRGMFANFGVAIGGLVPLLVPDLPFPTFFFISAGIYGLLLILIFKIPNNEENKQSQFSLKHIKDIIKNKSFIIFNLLVLLVWAVYALLTLLLPLRGQAVLKNAKIVGSIFSLTSLFLVLFQTFITKHVIKRVKYYNALILGSLTMGIGLFIMGYSYNYPILLLSSIIFIIGEMLIAPSIDSLTSEFADKEVMGTCFSIVNITNGLATAIGSFFSGKIVDHYGIKNNTPWFIFLTTTIIIGLIIFIVNKSNLIKSKKNINK